MSKLEKVKRIVTLIELGETETITDEDHDTVLTHLELFIDIFEMTRPAYEFTLRKIIETGSNKNKERAREILGLKSEGQILMESLETTSKERRDEDKSETPEKETTIKTKHRDEDDSLEEIYSNLENI